MIHYQFQQQFTPFKSAEVRIVIQLSEVPPEVFWQFTQFSILPKFYAKFLVLKHPQNQITESLEPCTPKAAENTQESEHTEQKTIEPVYHSGGHC